MDEHHHLTYHPFDLEPFLKVTADPLAEVQGPWVYVLLRLSNTLGHTYLNSGFTDPSTMFFLPPKKLKVIFMVFFGLHMKQIDLFLCLTCNNMISFMYLMQLLCLHPLKW